MSCESPRHHGHAGFMGHHGCCCCFPRRYYSAQEEKERLQRYKDQLEKELAGVVEELKKMK